MARKAITKDRLTAHGKHIETELHRIHLGRGNGPRVKIGVTQSHFGDPKKPKEEASFSLGEIAVVNEFGTADGHVPERSFIRSTHDEKREIMIALIDKYRHDVLVRFLTAKAAMGRIGVTMQKNIQDKILTLRYPPNAPSTIARKTRAGKKGDKPLVNTGQLLRSISYEIHGVN